MENSNKMETNVTGEYEDSKKLAEEQKYILNGPSLVLRENDQKRLKEIFDAAQSKVQSCPLI